MDSIQVGFNSGNMNLPILSQEPIDPLQFVKTEVETDDEYFDENDAEYYGENGEDPKSCDEEEDDDDNIDEDQDYTIGPKKSKISRKATQRTSRKRKARSTTTTPKEPRPGVVTNEQILTELQDYLHCWKCFKTFYKLPNLIKHYKRTCRDKDVLSNNYDGNQGAHPNFQWFKTKERNEKLKAFINKSTTVTETPAKIKSTTTTTTTTSGAKLKTLTIPLVKIKLKEASSTQLESTSNSAIVDDSNDYSNDFLQASPSSPFQSDGESVDQIQTQSQNKNKNKNKDKKQENSSKSEPVSKSKSKSKSKSSNLSDGDEESDKSGDDSDSENDNDHDSDTFNDNDDNAMDNDNDNDNDDDNKSGEEGEEELWGEPKSKKKTGHVECPTCGKILTKSSYPAHKILHKGVKPYHCKIEGCTKAFPTGARCREHELSHQHSKPWKCTDFPPCVRCFVSRSRLVRHLRGVHKTSTLPKDIPQTVERPPAVPQKDKPRIFKCEYPNCTSVFNRRASLRYHEKGVHWDKVYQCDFPGCTRKFGRSYEVTKHKRVVHEKLRKYLCSECGWGSASMSNHKRHMMTHTGEKNFICEACARAFVSKNELERHFLIHEDSRPYVCEYCSKAFRRRSGLVRHQKLHNRTLSHVCKFCTDAKFERHLLLKTHVKQVHADRLSEIDLKNPESYRRHDPNQVPISQDDDEESSSDSNPKPNTSKKDK